MIFYFYMDEYEDEYIYVNSDDEFDDEFLKTQTITDETDATKYVSASASASAGVIPKWCTIEAAVEVDKWLINNEHEYWNLLLTNCNSLFSDKIIEMLNCDPSDCVTIRINTIKFTADILIDSKVSNGFIAYALKNIVKRAFVEAVISVYDSKKAHEFWETYGSSSRYDLEPCEFIEIAKRDGVNTELTPIANLISLLETRISNLEKYCIICGINHCSLMTHPIFCSSSLCKDNYCQIGFGNLYDLIYQDINIADLKLNIYYNFLIGGRSELNLPTHLINAIFGFDAEPDQQTIKSTLLELFDQLGSVKEIAEKSTVYPRKINIFVTWMLTSYKLIPKRTKSSTKAKSKYRLYMNRPEFINQFEEQCSKNKVVKVWHGSKPDCWANIFEVGLLSMSNSKKYCTTGAAYGEGIYVGATSSVSNGYTASFMKDRPNTLNKLVGRSFLLKGRLVDPDTNATTDNKPSPSMYIIKNPNAVCMDILYIR